LPTYAAEIQTYESRTLGGVLTIPFNDLRAQYLELKPQIHERINRVLEHGQYIMGPEVQELEKKLGSFTGAKHCVTVSSGTEALLISLMALGIEQGDEVITTPFTFAATVEAIVLIGAKPIFVDIESDTCNINAEKIAEKINKKTKAIMPVSLYGQPADMGEINAIAASHGNIPVIEDAAQSFGATYRGMKSCNLSTIGCTSFFPSKPLGCYGDGGAIFTNNDSIAKACKEIRVHGQSARYFHTRVGVGGRMDTLQCAIVLAKLERFVWEIQQRITIGERYTQLLSSNKQSLEVAYGNGQINPVKIRKDRTSVYAQYTLICDDREAAQNKLSGANIPTAIHYPVPMNEQPAYKHLCCPDCTPVAKQMAMQVISLPMGADLEHTTQLSIIERLFLT
jgi:UDP-2-acetamido-2-deoxy-ribo-hexuluronate aminotransferase